MPNYCHINEKELLFQVSCGNEMAFTQIYNEYQPLLSTHIFRLTKSSALTDEITQDVFMKIWSNRQALASINNFKAYLAVISRNHALNALRQISREKLLIRKWQTESFSVAETEDTLPGYSNKFEDLLDKAIDQLPPQQKTAYILARHQRMKYSEIAEKLHLTSGTVKRYLQIATESITRQIHAQSLKDMLKTIILLVISRL